MARSGKGIGGRATPDCGRGIQRRLFTLYAKKVVPLPILPLSIHFTPTFDLDWTTVSALLVYFSMFYHIIALVKLDHRTNSAF